MEEKFLAAWEQARKKAEGLGVRMRPVSGSDAIEQAHRILSGHRESDGFSHLARLNRLDLSLEALAVSKAYTGLFSDEEANAALNRLMDAGYRFR